MAMTKTRTLKYLEVHPAELNDVPGTNAGNPFVHVYYNVTVDDPNDTELPVRSTLSYRIDRYADEADGLATDLSAEDQLVQDACRALWTS